MSGPRCSWEGFPRLFYRIGMYWGRCVIKTGVYRLVLKNIMNSPTELLTLILIAVAIVSFRYNMGDTL